MAYVTDIYMPVHFSIFREKGLSGNDALLYALLCFLAKGGTATRTVAWLAGELNVSQDTVFRSLDKLVNKELTKYVVRKERNGKYITFFMAEYPQNTGKIPANCPQNAVPQTPLTREKENIKENIIKENKKERFSQNEDGKGKTTQEGLSLMCSYSAEEQAEIREHQMNIMRKLHLIEQQTQDPGGQKRKARAAAEEAAHRPQENDAQKVARLMQQAYERGRALRDIISDKDAFDAALAKSFHNEKDSRLNEMLRRECKRGWQEVTAH